MQVLVQVKVKVQVRPRITASALQKTSSTALEANWQARRVLGFRVRDHDIGLLLPIKSPLFPTISPPCSPLYNILSIRHSNQAISKEELGNHQPEPGIETLVVVIFRTCISPTSEDSPEVQVESA
jgi:hypothetical protein